MKCKMHFLSNKLTDVFVIIVLFRNPSLFFLIGKVLSSRKNKKSARKF